MNESPKCITICKFCVNNHDVDKDVCICGKYACNACGENVCAVHSWRNFNNILCLECAHQSLEDLKKWLADRK